jgi:hypothetical protein
MKASARREEKKEGCCLATVGAIIRENYMFMLTYVYHALLHGIMG